MTRQKKVQITKKIERDTAESAFANYAGADAKLKKITAEMDVQITKIREKYQDEIGVLTSVKDDNFEIMEVYAKQNPELFVKRKSFEFAHGLIGFRTGTPKLKTLKGFTWPSVTKLLKEFLPKYVRISEEPAKDLLLADREDGNVSQLMGKCGIYVDQDETFFVEPKKEAVA